jgi:hypothetical protein
MCAAKKNAGWDFAAQRTLPGNSPDQEHFVKSLFVKTAQRFHKLPVAVIILFALIPLAAQHRPKTADEGEVKETKSRPREISSLPDTPLPKPRRAYSILIVRTDPADAEVAIDGKVEGKAENGVFIKELPAGKKYTISVSAGPDYQPRQETVKLKSRKPERVNAALLPNYGVVMLGPAVEGGRVLIDGVPAPVEKTRFNRDSSTITVSSLSPGEYRIAYDQPEYAIVERTFKISPGSLYTWVFRPERATAELKVASEPDTSVYVDNEFLGKTTSEGKLRRDDISIGEHEIRLQKDGFEEYKERQLFEFRKTAEIIRSLVPLPTSGPFDDDFESPNLNRWKMPASGWKIEGGRLHLANASELVSPTEIRYRDFTMHFHLKLENAGGAVWALRAKDEKNYYLFYLSGPEGLFPGRFMVYIVRDGKFDPKDHVASHPHLMALNPGDQFDIFIKATGNEIAHIIKPLSTGKEEPLGYFVDPQNVFPIGGMGLRTIGAEKFSIDELYIEAPKSQSSR